MVTHLTAFHQRQHGLQGLTLQLFPEGTQQYRSFNPCLLVSSSDTTLRTKGESSRQQVPQRSLGKKCVQGYHRPPHLYHLLMISPQGLCSHRGLWLRRECYTHTLCRSTYSSMVGNLRAKNARRFYQSCGSWRLWHLWDSPYPHRILRAYPAFVFILISLVICFQFFCMIWSFTSHFKFEGYKMSYKQIQMYV